MLRPKTKGKAGKNKRWLKGVVSVVSRNVKNMCSIHKGLTVVSQHTLRMPHDVYAETT